MISILTIELTKEMFIQALNYARETYLIDNLRVRSEFVSFDSKLRGRLGEIGMIDFLTQNGVKIHESNTLLESNIDIDLTYQEDSGKKRTIEVKTSLIPDFLPNIEECLKRMDIKFIKREQHFTEIPVDIVVQMYYNQKTKERDRFLNSIRGNPSDYSDPQLTEILDLDKLKLYFVSWIDKFALFSYLRSTNRKTYKIAKRFFWSAPMGTIGKKPEDLAKFILKSGE